MRNSVNALLAQRLRLSPDGRPYHAHAANEFLLVERGRGAHRTHLGGHEFGPGDIAFFARGQMHRLEVRSRAASALSVRFRSEALLADSEIDLQARARLDHLKRRAFLGMNRLDLAPDARRRLARLMREAVEECESRRSGFACALKGIALQLIIEAARDPSVGVHEGEVALGRGIVAALAWLDECHTRRVSVAEIARIACLSRSHFHEVFRRATGGTLVEHVRRLRVGTAVRLIQTTDMPLLDICFASGFGGTSRFYEDFRRLHGVTPGEYRRRTRATSL